MTTLTTTLLLTAILLAGCSAAVETGASASTTRERALCEQSRSPGVWVAAAGACIRGGGGM